MADDLVVREWVKFETDLSTDESIAEHNALVRAYRAVVAERDRACKSAILWGNKWEDCDRQLAAMTAERDRLLNFAMNAANVRPGYRTKLNQLLDEIGAKA